MYLVNTKDYILYSANPRSAGLLDLPPGTCFSSAKLTVRHKKATHYQNIMAAVPRLYASNVIVNYVLYRSEVLSAPKLQPVVDPIKFPLAFLFHPLHFNKQKALSVQPV